MTLFDVVWLILTTILRGFGGFPKKYKWFDNIWPFLTHNFGGRRFSKIGSIIWQYLTFFDAQIGHFGHFRRHFWDIIWFDFIWLYLTNYWFDVIWRGCLFDVIWRYLTLEFDNFDVFWQNLTKFDKTSDKTLISFW